MASKLYRSRDDRMLFGVCGGLAKYLGMDSTLVRVIMALLALAGGVGILLYIILAFLMPLEGSGRTEPRDVVVDNVVEIRDTAEDIGKGIKEAFTTGKSSTASEDTARLQARRRNAFGIVLIIIGGLFLLGTFGVLSWLRWAVLWPLALIAIGLFILFGVTRRR